MRYLNADSRAEFFKDFSTFCSWANGPRSVQHLGHLLRKACETGFGIEVRLQHIQQA
jgi:hypothetical protein